MSLHDHSEKHTRVLEQVTEQLTSLGYTVKHARPTGSAYYGVEHPGDFDVLVLLKEPMPVSQAGRFQASGLLLQAADIEQVIGQLRPLGYQDCRYVAEPGELGYEGDDYGETWAAVRGGEVNIVMTNSHEWYIRASAATALTREVSLKDGRVPPKEHTVDVFRICRFED